MKARAKTRSRQPRQHSQRPSFKKEGEDAFFTKSPARSFFQPALIQRTALPAAATPTILKKPSTSSIKESLKAQKAFWDDLNAYFPQEGRKLAGSGYDLSIDHLKTSFYEGKKGGVSTSAPIVDVGKKYRNEKDADKRKAWIKAEIKKINVWRVKTGQIDDDDAGDAQITALIDALDIPGKLDLLEKMKNRKRVKNDTMQLVVRNKMPSTPWMTGATERMGGEFEVHIENIKIVVKPDVMNSSHISEPAKTFIRRTSGSFAGGTPGFAPPTGVVTHLTGPVPTTPQLVFEIQTHYRPGVTPESVSGYGAGTRAGDAGEQTKLRFHEGMHGSVFIQEVQNNISANPYPTWKAAVGQTATVFKEHADAYKEGALAFQRMIRNAQAAQIQQVDCVGKTIDQYNLSKGITTTLCIP